MKAERPLKVIFYQTDTGNEPVREWLKALSKENCKTIGADIVRGGGSRNRAAARLHQETAKDTARRTGIGEETKETI
jgi:hypothetical protein